MEKFKPILESIDYVPTGEKLILRYDQMHDASSKDSDPSESRCVQSQTAISNCGSTQPKAERRGWGSQDRDEEAYFNDDDEEAVDDVAEAAVDSTGHLPSLRKHEDDDDEEEGVFAQRLSSKTSTTKTESSAPPSPRRIMFSSSITMRNIEPRKGGYGLVDYDDDNEETPPRTASSTPTKRSSSVLSPSPPYSGQRQFEVATPPAADTPTKIRSLTRGAKRMALGQHDDKQASLDEDDSAAATTTTSTEEASPTSISGDAK